MRIQDDQGSLGVLLKRSNRIMNQTVSFDGVYNLQFPNCHRMMKNNLFFILQSDPNDY